MPVCAQVRPPSSENQGLAPLVAAPTIVFHARDDAASPFEEGRQLASLIPTARLVPP
jgi:hypothetical protein